jgi:hypothetical protein
MQLMEKRGQYHSGRPRLVFAGEMCGWDHTIGASSDMDWVREIRKRVYQVIGTKAGLSKFYPLQEMEVHRFLLRTLQEPEKVVSNLRTYVLFSYSAITIMLIATAKLEPSSSSWHTVTQLSRTRMTLSWTL